MVAHFLVKHTGPKTIVSLSSHTHQVIRKMRAPEGTSSVHPRSRTARTLQVKNTERSEQTKTGTPYHDTTINHEGYMSFDT